MPKATVDSTVPGLTALLNLSELVFSHILGNVQEWYLFSKVVICLIQLTTDLFQFYRF